MSTRTLRVNELIQRELSDILRKQYQVERLAMTLDSRVSVEAAVAGDVGLYPEDWIDVCLSRLDIEIDGAI